MPDLDHDSDTVPDDRDDAFDYEATLRREHLDVQPPHWGWFVLGGVALLALLVLLAS